MLKVNFQKGIDTSKYLWYNIITVKVEGEEIMQKLNIIKKLVARYMWLSGRASYSMIAKRLGVYPATVRKYLKGVEQAEGRK